MALSSDAQPSYSYSYSYPCYPAASRGVVWLRQGLVWFGLVLVSGPAYSITPLLVPRPSSFALRPRQIVNRGFYVAESQDVRVAHPAGCQFGRQGVASIILLFYYFPISFSITPLCCVHCVSVLSVMSFVIMFGERESLSGVECG